MADAIRQRLYTVPTGTSLVDALARHLLQNTKDDATALADVLILLPNNRAITSLTESFVRQTETGLLLPRMVAVGDLSLDTVLGPLFDPVGSPHLPPIPPAISDVDRLVLLSGMIRKKRSVSLVEALKLAKKLAAAMDLLEVEEVRTADLRNADLKPDLQAHWQSAYDDFLALSDAFAAALVRRGQVTATARRNALLDRFAASLPTDRLVVAAGITTAAPAIARLLKAVARRPNAIVVWPHVDMAMADGEWDALGPAESESGIDFAEETHPQFHLKLLFDRMGMAREELHFFPGTAPAPSAQTIDRIFGRPEAVMTWAELPGDAKRLKQVRLLTANESAEEALSIAILIRQALEIPEKRIALVTPDRELATRVGAQLFRWGIQVDDSAGQPLQHLPPAALLLALAQVMASRMDPMWLLAVLKHPLVKAGDDRIAWLESVRLLDLALRGPRIGVGLNAISEAIGNSDLPKEKKHSIGLWWQQQAANFQGFDDSDPTDLPQRLRVLIDAAEWLTDGRIWQGTAGRQLAQLLEDYQTADIAALGAVDSLHLPAILSQLLDSEVVRPVYGSHPRVSIYGLLEARLQQADLVICSGLNEGSWPQLQQPDPWLAPWVRRALKLPGLDRNIGLSAYDLAAMLGSGEVILSRAKRDRSGPTVASRFLLRIQALLGSQLQQEDVSLALARRIDTGPGVPLASRPKPMPSIEQRAVRVSVTQMDLLKADPFAFYARNILGLKPLDSVGGEPDAAWRGVAIHEILEKWAKEDGREPDLLIARAERMLANPAFHPAVRILWQPRITSALKWVAGKTADLRQEGRHIASTESWGRLKLAGVDLIGRADRIDRTQEGGLVIVDYKSGQPPTTRSVKAGYSLQLGLIGAMAEAGGIDDVRGTVCGFEYWSLAKAKNGDFGFIKSPVSPKNGEAAEFIPKALHFAREAVENWITGSAPFTAKLHPEYAPYDDYNQLMRLNEWYGRQEDSGEL